MTDLVEDAQQTEIDSSPPFDLGVVDDTPEVAVDLGRLQANIARAASAAEAHGIGLRPHVKTHKMPQIAALQMRAGAVGIQVAKLGEAEVFAAAGVPDIFIGYPLVGPRKVARLIYLLEHSDATISIATDSIEAARPIAAAAVAAGLRVPLLIEIDTGLRRLGVQPHQALNLARDLAELDGIELAGLFTHEGHVYTHARSFEEKRAMTRAACAAVADTAEAIRAEGIPLATVSVGSSGTFRFAVECENVTEIRPGTYVFNDFTQVLQGAATQADLAAFVVATVVGRPEATRAVIDAGSKVLTSDRLIVSHPETTFGSVAGYPGAAVTRLSEEHGLLELPPDTDMQVG
ncbi:MAG TPA: alanine racemase, partial [Ilumatobacteraceae bacterium]|nr:alanine racemase [Ilumatobacteraceae bacterium]